MPPSDGESRTADGAGLLSLAYQVAAMRSVASIAV